jgi:hypothetical protein
MDETVTSVVCIDNDRERANGRVATQERFKVRIEKNEPKV